MKREFNPQLVRKAFQAFVQLVSLVVLDISQGLLALGVQACRQLVIFLYFVEHSQLVLVCSVCMVIVLDD